MSERPLPPTPVGESEPTVLAAAPGAPAPAPAVAPSAASTAQPAPLMEPPLGGGMGSPNNGGWLPTRRQLFDAAQFKLAAAIGPEPEWPYFLRGLHSSMRQAMGLILLILLVAGLPLLVVTWIGLAERHSTLTLLQAEQTALRMVPLVPDVLGDELQAAAGLISALTPTAPAQSAAGLSALSAWLALPLRALTFWLAYGVLVLGVAKALGAGTTLPRFYAATGYPFLFLLTLLLYPLPVVGPWLALAGVALALIAYVGAVSVVTGLDRWRALICILLPAAVLALTGALLSAITLLVLR